MELAREKMVAARALAMDADNEEMADSASMVKGCLVVWDDMRSASVWFTKGR